MGVYFEALILYAVLFLSGALAPSGGVLGFSTAVEIERILLYNIPSLALIWYLLLKVKSLKDWGIGLPAKKDMLVALLSLPGILLIGFVTAFAASFFNAISEGAMVYAPFSVAGWAILGVSCLTTGYLEESFFRFYLLSRREELKLSVPAAILFSTAAFAACHIHEGPWGVANSALSGALLALFFLRFKSFHGIAIAHGLYNIIVYVSNAVSI